MSPPFIALVPFTSTFHLLDPTVPAAKCRRPVGLLGEMTSGAPSGATGTPPPPPPLFLFSSPPPEGDSLGGVDNVDRVDAVGPLRFGHPSFPCAGLSILTVLSLDGLNGEGLLNEKRQGGGGFDRVLALRSLEQRLATMVVDTCKGSAHLGLFAIRRYFSIVRATMIKNESCSPKLSCGPK